MFLSEQRVNDSTVKRTFLYNCKKGGDFSFSLIMGYLLLILESYDLDWRFYNVFSWLYMSVVYRRVIICIKSQINQSVTLLLPGTNIRGRGWREEGRGSLYDIQEIGLPNLNSR